MGDDGEKFGAWPGTYELCWGKESGSTASSRRSRQNARLAHDGHAVPVARRASAASGRIYIPTSSYVEMTGWALPADETVVFTALMDRAAATRPARAALPARRRSGATSRRAIARSTTCTSRCCAPRPRSRPCRPGPCAIARSTTCTAANRTTATGTACSAASTSSHMRMATLAELIAAEDLADRALGTMTTATIADYDLDGIDEVALGDAGQIVARRCRRRGRHRRAGTCARRGLRSRPCCAGGRSRTTRRCAPATPRSASRRRRESRRMAVRAIPPSRSTSSSGPRGRPRRTARSTTPRAAVRACAPYPSDVTRRGLAQSREREIADIAEAAYDRPSLRRTGLALVASRRRWRASRSGREDDPPRRRPAAAGLVVTVGPEPIRAARRPARGRVGPPARRGRQPGRVLRR